MCVDVLRCVALCCEMFCFIVLCNVFPVFTRSQTTTIHMLAGFHEATAGDARICGYSIRDGMDQIQRQLGICPQFGESVCLRCDVLCFCLRVCLSVFVCFCLTLLTDIMWNELTGEEHLTLFSGLRGLDRDARAKEVSRLIQASETHTNTNTTHTTTHSYRNTQHTHTQTHNNTLRTNTQQHKRE